MVNVNPSFDPWQLEEAPPPLHEQSLEEVLQLGGTQHDEQREGDRISIHSYPSILQAAVYNRMQVVGGRQAVAHRLITKLGSSFLQHLPEIAQLEESKRSIFTTTFSPLAVASAFAKRTYTLQNPVFLQPGARRNVPVFWWVQGLLSDLALTTSLPVSQITVLAIVAGVSRSVELPEELAVACQGELEDFQEFLQRNYALSGQKCDVAVWR